MNRLGMLVDVSHVSEKTMSDVLAVSKAPVFASHSSCRALANIPRNMTDEQIQAVAAKGGVVMVNVSTLFLDQKSVDAYLAARTALQPQIAEIRERLKGDPKKRDAEVRKLRKTIQYPDADWTTAVDHIERVMKLGGPQAVGLGTDYDGIDDPPGRPRGRLEAPEADRRAPPAGPLRGGRPRRPRGELPEVLGPGRGGPEGHARRGPSRFRSRSRDDSDMIRFL